MYTVNTLMRNVLITFEEVMFHAPTMHTVDRRQIESSIIIAEERFVRSEIGSAMYDDMATAKNVLVTASNIGALQTAINLGITDPQLQTTLVEGDVVNALEQMSPTYQALWKQYLWKICAECVIVTALPEGFVQFSSEGAFHKVPPAGLMVTSGLVTPLLPSIKWTLDKKVQDRVAPLLVGMHEYLCTKKTDYIYYNSANCPDCNTKDTGKWSGLCLNIYDDDEDDGCCT